jgi:DNA-binding PadR family transcriptional regulator
MEFRNAQGHLDAIVLAALEAGPAHGYAIIETIKHGSSNTFDLPERSTRRCIGWRTRGCSAPG